MDFYFFPLDWGVACLYKPIPSPCVACSSHSGLLVIILKKLVKKDMTRLTMGLD
jgi:hypothetical protein